MKLLSKEELQQKKSSERASEVREAAKLAKTIDNLRELTAKEQANLAKFRDESIQSIKDEITLNLKQKNDIIRDIKELEEDRIRKSAPIDLTKEWERVKNDRLQVEEWKRELYERETNLISREGRIITLEQDFEKRNVVFTKSEVEAKQYLEETSKSYRIVEEIRNSIEARKKQSDDEITGRYSTLTENEEFFSKEKETLKNAQSQLEQEKKILFEQSNNLLQREHKVELKENELFERDEVLKQNENLNQHYLTESQANYQKSEQLKLETEEYKEKTEQKVSQELHEIANKKKQLDYREHDLNLQKEQIEKDKIDIANERIHITSQQETLRVAWANIKKLNNK